MAGTSGKQGDRIVESCECIVARERNSSNPAAMRLLLFSAMILVVFAFNPATALLSSSGVDAASSVPTAQDLQPSTRKPLPFIVLHGIGDECRNHGLYEFTQLLINMSGAVGFCIEIGNGASDSFFMRLDKQADIVCEQVKKIPELKDGYNMVGLSQGNVVARAVIEFCDGGPPVNNFVSLGGPHAGTASIPRCTLMSLCKLADSLIRLGVYSAFVQNHLAPSGYVKIPNDLDAYYRGSLFLPKLNNEIASNRNETYKKRLESLNHLVLIMFQQDSILIPPSTAWFGYYAENDFTTAQAPEETDLYKEDWIGLRALDESGRVTYIAFPGDHLSIDDLEVRDFVVPYLRNSPNSPSSSEF